MTPARRRVTDLPAGLHLATSVLWLHAKKKREADFPLGKTQSLAAAAEQSIGSA